MKILFTGGGTMGPVTPLLAVFEAWKKKDPNVSAFWIGTPNGPERVVVESAGIAFEHLPVARLTRYPSIEWLQLVFRLAIAFYKAYKIIKTEKPDLIASAGGFTAVPVVLAGYLLGVKVWVHQQDVELILTNRITSRFADYITVAWERNLKDFPKRAVLIGNPVRPSVLTGSKDKARKFLGVKNDKPIVLVVGGGGGSAWINSNIGEIAEELLVHANIVHVTGRGKNGLDIQNDGYYSFEFLQNELADLMSLAEVVVSRAGLGFITELSALKKASIVIPLPNSPQEENADAINNSCVVLREGFTTSKELLDVIVELLDDSSLRYELGGNMGHVLRTDVADEIVELLAGKQKIHS